MEASGYLWYLLFKNLVLFLTQELLYLEIVIRLNLVNELDELNILE